jgi:hypothetical protein
MQQSVRSESPVGGGLLPALFVFLFALVLGCQPEVLPTPPGTGGQSATEYEGEGGGAPGIAGQGGEGGAGGQGPRAGSVCLPTAEDEPDDEFADSNCDGIDGDIAHAVFVAPDGDDSSPGTMQEPLGSLAAALAVTKAKGGDIYVCNGLYEQAVVIRDQGVRIFGGYDCAADWQRVTDRARFTSKLAVPLLIENAVGVLIERIAFIAPDVTTPSGSSIAAIIDGSEDVELRRVQLESGAAGAGEAGVAGSPLSGSAPKGANGQAGCLTLGCSEYGQGGESKTAAACEGGGAAEPGGFGGDGAHAGTPPQAGWASASGALGGKVSSSLTARDGQAGDAGATGSVGAASSRLIGEFEGRSYVATNSGAPGLYGKHGQGGGGGAGGPEVQNSDICCVPGFGASQGGFGGCGGRPGQGAAGGGASIALVIVNSQVELFWTRLLSGNGGDGGMGGLGGAPQAGGAGGGVPLFAGLERVSGLGGPGGSGGAGGSGGPGGGGPSLGLALIGAPLPTMEGVQVLLGSPGFGGAAAPDAALGSDAPDGLSAPGYDFSADSPLSF